MWLAMHFNLQWFYWIINRPQMARMKKKKKHPLPLLCLDSHGLQRARTSEIMSEMCTYSNKDAKNSGPPSMSL